MFLQAFEGSGTNAGRSVTTLPHPSFFCFLFCGAKKLRRMAFFFFFLSFSFYVKRGRSFPFFSLLVLYLVNETSWM